MRIQNTGDINAMIRASIVVTWKNADGEIYGRAPVAGTDYEMVLDLTNGWSKSSDGFYYWNKPVAPDAFTGVLITSCTAIESNVPDGYSLNVEIIASGIQAEGIPAGSHPWGI